MPRPGPRLLAVDDDPHILSLLARIGAAEGFAVATARTLEQARAELRQHQTAIVLLDVRMPGATGLEHLTSLHAASPTSRMVVMTGFASLDGAVTAGQLGASEYLAKPLDTSRLRLLLRHLLPSEPAAGTPRPRPAALKGLIGTGRAMKEVWSLLERLAPHARTTLITGETGTGKELAARALHALGPRADNRLVTVNCSAVVETLFESELFGHVRGAFTGATENKTGLFEAADGGTLFLDEVGELPSGAQAKLLRVLEDGEVQRIGSLESRRVDVRIIAATNRDLRAEVRAGRFRDDLFHRLNVVSVHMPPLRMRREDIPTLARAFTDSCARTIGRQVTGVTAEAEALLVEARWGGNVRELRNVIERACILASADCLTADDLRGSMDAGDDDATSRATASPSLVPMPPRACGRLEDVEREHIVRTLAEVHGNKALAARMLGVSRRALYRQLERHGLHQRLPETARTLSANAVAALGHAS